jgi:hypothetical protein
VSEPAPIALFIYNRPTALRRTLATLLKCEKFARSRVYVFADGPKFPSEKDAVEEARKVAIDMLGREAHYVFAEANRGLASSLVSGVSDVVREHSRVIVVEDDLTLSRGFLDFLNRGLDRFEADERVYQVSGHFFDVPEFAARQQSLLLPITTTWGWGTWARAWRHLDLSAKGWSRLSSDAALRRRFNLQGAYDYASMLRRQVADQGKSWGALWYWSVFKRGGLTLFPPRTLVSNHGMDGSGTNGAGRFRGFGQQAMPSSNEPAGVEVEILSQASDEALRRLVYKAVWNQNGRQIGKLIDVAKRLRLSAARIGSRELQLDLLR